MKSQYLKILKGCVAVAAFAILCYVLCYKAHIKIGLGEKPFVQLGEETEQRVSDAIAKTEQESKNDVTKNRFETNYEFSGNKKESANFVSETEESSVHKAIGLPSLRDAITEHKTCRLGAITAYGAGVVIFGDNGYAYHSIPEGFSKIIKKLRSQHEVINDIVLTESGYYCCIYGRNGWWGNVPKGVREILNKSNKAKEKIISISISENGEYVIVTDKYWYASDYNNREFIKKKIQKYSTTSFKHICITDSGICVVFSDGTICCNGSANSLIEVVDGLSFRPDRIVFTDYGTYLMTSNNGNYWYHI